MKRFTAIALAAAFLAAPTASFAGAFNGDESVVIFKRGLTISQQAPAKKEGVLKTFERSAGWRAERFDYSE